MKHLKEYTFFNFNNDLVAGEIDLSEVICYYKDSPPASHDKLSIVTAFLKGGSVVSINCSYNLFKTDMQVAVLSDPQVKFQKLFTQYNGVFEDWLDSMKQNVSPPPRRSASKDDVKFTDFGGIDPENGEVVN